MTSEALLKAIGAADDAVLLRCERPARRPYVYIAVAACAALAITIGLLAPHLAPVPPSLPAENSTTATTVATTTSVAPTTATPTTTDTTAAPTTTATTTTSTKQPTKTSSVQIPLNAVCLTDGITPSEWISVPDADREMATLLSEFSVSLLKNAYSGSGNHVTAPLTLYTALSMLYSGADGTTAAQMKQVLGASPAFINERLGTLLRDLRTDTENSLLQTANSLWLANGNRVATSYLQNMVDAYDAEVFSGPLSKDGINRWVSENTRGRIPELLKSAPPALAEMYLVTAQAYMARWRCTGQQVEMLFKNADGTQITVNGVQLQERFCHAYISGAYTTVVCPLEKANMLIIMPHEGTLTDLLSGLRAQDLLDASSHGGTKYKYAEVTLPQFSARSYGDFKSVLSKMGMTEIFSKSADFRKMGYEIGALAVAGVETETVFSVDRTGVDAASAVAIYPTISSELTEEPIAVTIDRPFFYAVVDSESQIPLYVGVQDSVN